MLRNCVIFAKFITVNKRSEEGQLNCHFLYYSNLGEYLKQRILTENFSGIVGEFEFECFKSSQVYFTLLRIIFTKEARKYYKY